MKTKLLLFLITVATLTFNSCKKDDAANDPCAKTICLNDGYCANGDCVCPEGYTGADCSKQETPSQIRITKIEVTRFPATDNGAGWDLTSGLDIFPMILKGNTKIWESSNYIQNANPSNIYSFSLTPPLSLTSPSDQYTISLYDYDDLDADDFMGGIYFTPYSSNNGFPNIKIIDAGSSVAFKLHITYVW